MRKKFLLIAIIFFCSAFSRPTTFDDREVCEKSGGVWRQFGSSCIDGCEAKLNELAVCTPVTLNACQCAKSQCWDDDKKSCVSIKDYKKIFEARLAEEKKLAEEAKKKREEESQQSQAPILSNQQNSNPIAPEKTAQENQEKKDQPTIADPKPSEPSPAQETPVVAQPPSPMVNDTKSIVPPLFLEKEKQEQAKKDAQKNQSEPQKNPSSPVNGLPVIPLPQ